MYFEELNSTRKEATSKSEVRGISTRDFVFLSQDLDTRFSAETCIDILRITNNLLGEEVYRWSNHILDDKGFSELKSGQSKTLVLSGGIFKPWIPEKKYYSDIKTHLRNAGRVCIIGSAIFVPLCVGILKTQIASIHPNFQIAVKERGYLCNFHEEKFCHYKSLSTAISSMAAVEMMLDLIALREGEFIKIGVRDLLGLSFNRRSTRSREHWHFKRLAQGKQIVVEALDLMLDHLEDTLTVGQIAKVMAVSPRRLERSFGNKIKLSPLQVYRSLRLELANKLLLQTEMPISEISIACGFSNVTLLTKWYRNKFGIPPLDTRKMAYSGKHVA